MQWVLLVSIVVFVFSFCAKTFDISNVTKHKSLEFAHTCAHVCQTKWCQFYSEILNETIDFTVDPCDDFYRHVCGNWPHKLSYLSLQLESAFEIVQYALDDFALNDKNGNSKALRFLSDLNQDYIDWSESKKLAITEPITELLKQILGNDWSLFGNAPSSFAFDEKINENDKPITVAQFEKYWKQWKSKQSKVEHDHHSDVEQWMDCVVETSLIKVPFLIERIKIFDNDDDGFGQISIIFNLNEKIEDLYAHFVNLQSTYSSLFNITTSNNSLIRDLFEVIEFKLKLASLFKDVPNRYSDFKVMSLAQLNSHSFDASFNWTRLVNKFTRRIGSSVQVSDHDRVGMVTDYLDQLTSVTELIATTPIRVLKNVIALQIIERVKLLLIDKMQIYQENQSRRLLKETLSTNDFHQLRPLYTRLFVDYLGREEMQKALEQVREMVNSMKKTFAQSIKQNSYNWLDQQTRNTMLDRVDKMEAMISHPDWIFDDGALDEQIGFDHVEKYPNIKGNFIANYFNLIRILKSAEFRKQIKNHHKQKQFDFVFNSIGEYSAVLNQLKITSALLHVPSFNVDYPISLKYGMVGTTVGHELLHAFDDKARYSMDSAFKITNWWTDSDVEQYDNRSQCFVRQYDQLVDPYTRKKVNGTITLTENISDNGGLKLAYRVMEKHLNTNSNSQTLPSFLAQYSHEQLFFLSFGLISCSNDKFPVRGDREHSPAKYRVNIPLRNFDKFAQAFNCPVGSKMNPVDKCELW